MSLTRLNNLVTVVKSQLLKVHDLFFNTTPQTVIIKRLKEDDTIEEVEMPNIAQINADLLEGGNAVQLAGGGRFDIATGEGWAAYFPDEITVLAYKYVLPVAEFSSFLDLLPNKLYFFEFNLFGYIWQANAWGVSLMNHKAVVSVYWDGSAFVMKAHSNQIRGLLVDLAITTPIQQESGFWGLAFKVDPEAGKLLVGLNIHPENAVAGTSHNPFVWGTVKKKVMDLA